MQFFNTYHVPILYEYVGNYIWGKKYSGRRSVKTGGKEKDLFTRQIRIRKGLIKCIPYILYLRVRIVLSAFIICM